MNNLNSVECKKIIGGGINFSGTLINALKGCVNIFFELGQSVGGALRRITTNNLCKF